MCYCSTVEFFFNCVYWFCTVEFFLQNRVSVQSRCFFLQNRVSLQSRCFFFPNRVSLPSRCFFCKIEYRCGPVVFFLKTIINDDAFSFYVTRGFLFYCLLFFQNTIIDCLLFILSLFNSKERRAGSSHRTPGSPSH